MAMQACDAKRSCAFKTFFQNTFLGLSFPYSFKHYLFGALIAYVCVVYLPDFAANPWVMAGLTFDAAWVMAAKVLLFPYAMFLVDWAGALLFRNASARAAGNIDVWSVLGKFVVMCAVLPFCLYAAPFGLIALGIVNCRRARTASAPASDPDSVPAEAAGQSAAVESLDAKKPDEKPETD